MVVSLLFLSVLYISLLFNSFRKSEIYILVYHENRRKEKKISKLDTAYKYIVLGMFHLRKDLLTI